MFFPIFINNSTCIDNCEFRLKIFFWDRVRANKHIGDKMMLPGHFSNKSDSFGRLRTSTTISIKNVHILYLILVKLLNLGI